MKRILVVEDETDLNNLLKGAFEKEGFEVIQTFNGKQAELVLQNNTEIDLILLDLMMPEMGGTAFLYRQQELGKSTIPVIIFTNVESGSYPSHVIDYIVKSNIDLHSIVKRVKRYFEGTKE